MFIDLKNTNSIKGKYIAYLDQKYLGHPEFDFLKQPNFLYENFYDQLKIFLNKIEEFYNREVIFCAHPRAKLNDAYLKKFKNVELNKSAYFSKNSDLVIAHDSVSLNFPILFKKPILLVKIPGMELNNKENNIEATSKFLNCNLTNLNNLNFDHNWLEKKINNSKYEEYIKNYIKYGGEHINSWEIISKKLLEIK